MFAAKYGGRDSAQPIAPAVTAINKAEAGICSFFLPTFPDDFIFHGSKESVRSQIGMAVPVDGAKIILNGLLMTFANKKYPSINPSNGFYPRKTLI